MSESNLDQSSHQNLEVFINEVANELEQAKDVYASCLRDLVDKVKTEKPKTIFFLDRSARPIAWMLSGALQELQKAEPEIPSPEIRFISLDEKFSPDKGAFGEAQMKYKFDRHAPVMVVDEFSESYKGKRNVDYAGDVFKKKLGAQNIIKHVFMERIKVGGIPRFYRGSDEEKRALYGIEDSGKESIISKATVQHGLSFERNRYRTIFIDFGKKVAKQLSAE